jgi:hypothetical protein
VVFNIRVYPRSGRNQVKEENGLIKVYLTHPAHEGLANKQLIELLSAHLKLKRYQVRIIKGGKSRNKVIEADVS